MRVLHFFLIVFILFGSCRRQEEPSSNKFSDSTLTKLYEFQDRRQPDSLAKYAQSNQLAYRQAITLSFASVQDTSYSSLLSSLLNDDDPLTRRHAAFAIGQTKGKNTEELLLERIQAENDSLIRFELFEALGKVARHETVKSFMDSDDVNVPWLYYRFGIRESCDSLIVDHVAKFLSADYPETCRLGAAHFFARGKIGSLAQSEQALIKSALSDPSPAVRMAAAAGLRHGASSEISDAIRSIIRNDDDYRVRVNAVKSLITFPFSDVKDILVVALSDENVNVAIAAAEVVRSTITDQFGAEFFVLANTTPNWRVQAILWEAAISIADDSLKEKIFSQVRDIYSDSVNSYQMASLLQVMAHHPKAFQFIRTILLSYPIPLIQSSAATALVAMNRKKHFPSALKEPMLQTYIQAISRGDVAVIGIVTDALTDSTLGFKSLVTNVEFLYQAKAKLSLPRDYESYEPLERAIAYFEDRTPISIEKNFNHPIDWSLVRTIPKDQQAVIKTTKGEIIIQLFVEEAPGSVGNFVDLVRRDYYDGKSFHRVVPNFVIQGGCPRGDGWGSEDYSIRSEFCERRYREGSMGMASAGKDTEGVQWFITHSATPHLDGRYTIFAEVTKGMDVVHEIEVGDKIIDIQLLP